MIRNRDNGMGRFSVEIEIANYDDMARARAGDIPDAQVRRTRVRGVVDTGATRLVLPVSVVRELGVPVTGKVGVRYADGRIADRDRVDGIFLTCLGRSSVFNAVIEPDRDSALIGAIVLEDLDLLVDCITQQLTPRDPERIISEAGCSNDRGVTSSCRADKTPREPGSPVGSELKQTRSMRRSGTFTGPSRPARRAGWVSGLAMLP